MLYFFLYLRNLHVKIKQASYGTAMCFGRRDWQGAVRGIKTLAPAAKCECPNQPPLSFSCFLLASFGGDDGRVSSSAGLYNILYFISVLSFPNVSLGL